jgi:hypothetical protein
VAQARFDPLARLAPLLCIGTRLGSGSAVGHREPGKYGLVDHQAFELAFGVAQVRHLFVEQLQGHHGHRRQQQQRHRPQLGRQLKPVHERHTGAQDRFPNRHDHSHSTRRNPSQDRQTSAKAALAIRQR